ncbi:unnamed protein product, partial [Ectocarpus fasciculatus]
GAGGVEPRKGLRSEGCGGGSQHGGNPWSGAACVGGDCPVGGDCGQGQLVQSLVREEHQSAGLSGEEEEGPTHVGGHSPRDAGAGGRLGVRRGGGSGSCHGSVGGGGGCRGGGSGSGSSSAGGKAAFFWPRSA